MIWSGRENRWWTLKISFALIIGLSIIFHNHFSSTVWYLLPWTKKKKNKEPSPKFTARRTQFNLVISCLITSDQRRARSSATIRDFCSALIARVWAWYHKIELCSSRREFRGWPFFFVQGSSTSSCRWALCTTDDISVCLLYNASSPWWFEYSGMAWFVHTCPTSVEHRRKA